MKKQVYYAVLSHGHNINGNRVSKILAVKDGKYSIFNMQCYEFQIPEYIRHRLNLTDEVELVKLEQVKYQEL